MNNNLRIYFSVFKTKCMHSSVAFVHNLPILTFTNMFLNVKEELHRTNLNSFVYKLFKNKQIKVRKCGNSYTLKFID